MPPPGNKNHIDDDSICISSDDKRYSVGLDER
jgi:hypothetical protein